MSDRLLYHERARLIFNSRVHANGKLILLALSDRIWKKDQAFPSYDRIARDTSLSRRCVINHIQKLVEAGLLEIVRTSDIRAANTYKMV